jgi:hypothetical protein
MRRLMPLLLCLLTGCATAAAQPPPPEQTPAPAPAKLALQAPGSIDYRLGKLIAVTATGAPGKVAWKVHPFPPTELDYAPQGTTLLVAMPPPGTEVWIVAGSGDQLAEATVRVKGAEAGGGSAGKPAPPVAGKVRHATVVYADTLPPAAKTLAESTSLKAALLERQIRLHGPVSTGTVAGLAAPAGGAVLILQAADGSILPPEQALPLTEGMSEAAVLAAVDRVNQGAK